MHGQSQQEKKALKKEHAVLVEKKNTLSSALTAVRSSVSKFDNVASFWNEFVNEPEEIERQQQRRARKSRARAAAAKAAKACQAGAELTKSKSCIMEIGGKRWGGEQDKQMSSSCSSSSWGLLLLQDGLGTKKTDTATTMTFKTEDTGSDRSRSDRRCDSCGDRDSRTSKAAGMPALMMPPIPKREPIEIKINFERVVAPLEDQVFPRPSVATTSIVSKAAIVALV